MRSSNRSNITICLLEWQRQHRLCLLKYGKPEESYRNIILHISPCSCNKVDFIIITIVITSSVIPTCKGKYNEQWWLHGPVLSIEKLINVLNIASINWCFRMVDNWEIVISLFISFIYSCIATSWCT